jgi:hypothetical protein
MGQMSQDRMILPPEEERIRLQLELRLTECQTRLEGGGNPWEHSQPAPAPGIQPAYLCTWYRERILAEVLTSGRSVSSGELSRRFMDEQGEDFDGGAFDDAFGIVADYADDNVRVQRESGTGLSIRDGLGIAGLRAAGI